MQLFSALAVSLSLLPLPASAEGMNPFVIYGEDNRRELFQVDPVRAALSASTLSLFSADALSANQDFVSLPVQPFGERFNLCPGEPFIDQPSGAFCSGSLVGPDLVLTAGHCVPDAARCSATAFVFGFAAQQPGPVPSESHAANVYGCGELVEARHFRHGADWALVRLNRPVLDRAPLQVNWDGAIANGTPLMIIGHPLGLPVKIADGASVRDGSPMGFFRTDLDANQGSSGAPVFNTDTGLIEGVLARVGVDLIDRGGCNVLRRCPQDGCIAAEATKGAAYLRLLGQELERSYLMYAQ